MTEVQVKSSLRLQPTHTRLNPRHKLYKYIKIYTYTQTQAYTEVYTKIPEKIHENHLVTGFGSVGVLTVFVKPEKRIFFASANFRVFFSARFFLYLLLIYFKGASILSHI